MPYDRSPSGDTELTRALRDLYAPPADPQYWDSLEARILAHVATREEVTMWWSALKSPASSRSC